jgi:hypothetical protein
MVWRGDDNKTRMAKESAADRARRPENVRVDLHAYFFAGFSYFSPIFSIFFWTRQ